MLQQPKIFAANWKMNLPRTGVEAYGQVCLEAASGKAISVLCFVPALVLERAVARCPGINWGAQNISARTAGAYTGEISAAMLRDSRCHWTLVGHSERRQLFGESVSDTAEKLQRAWECGLSTVLCIGETAQERARGETAASLAAQLAALRAVSLPASPGRLVVAYEPVWAIGTGQTPDRAQIEQANATISKLLGGGDAAKTIPILYGGSVHPGNVSEIVTFAGVDGILVGGASLELESCTVLIDALGAAVRARPHPHH